jgi:hypothetical protein
MKNFLLIAICLASTTVFAGDYEVEGSVPKYKKDSPMQYCEDALEVAGIEAQEKCKELGKDSFSVDLDQTTCNSWHSHALDLKFTDVNLSFDCH